MYRKDDWITDLDRKKQIKKKKDEKNTIEDSKPKFKGTIED